MNAGHFSASGNYEHKSNKVFKHISYFLKVSAYSLLAFSLDLIFWLQLRVLLGLSDKQLLQKVKKGKFKPENCLQIPSLSVVP